MTSLTADQVRIAQQYYSQLHLDSLQRSKPQFCICVIGLIGSGKSTFLDSLCQEIPVARHTGDKIRALLYQAGMSIGDNTLPIAIATSQWLRDEGFNIAYDNDLGNPMFLQEMHDINAKAGISEIWIRCNPPYEVILRNLRDDKHPYSFNALKRLTAQKAIHEGNMDAINSLPFVATLDYSQPDAPQQTTDAIRRIKQAIAAL